MKDYHNMLNSLKDKVVDAAGKAGETVTNAANKVVSDEMRDKVAGAAHAVGDRAKYASRMTRMTVDCNAELERVKRTYTEIGRLYYEQAKDAPEGFFAPLFAQAEEICGRIAAKELIREDFRITVEHGQWFVRDGVQMTATFHPSALLRDPSKRPEAFEDMKSIQAKVRELCSRTAPRSPHDPA